MYGFIFLSAAIFLIVILIIPYYLFLKKEVKISPFKTALGIRGEINTVNDSVNVLILGIPGGTHDGPTLSDSIVVAHIDFAHKKIVTLGIPRDIWSTTLKDKINSAYAYGEAQEKGGGMKLARAEVAAIIGQPIQYAAVINFSQFRDLINAFGGITVSVEHTFTDKKYPVAGREADECGGDPNFGCRYETIHFAAGERKMDGETALKFVRSRQAEGEEGTDFARNKRQERVLAAVKQRVLQIISVPTVSNARTVYKAFDTFFERDFTNQQGADIVRAVILKKDISITPITIPRDLFIVPPAYQYDGRYVLIPHDGNGHTIHAFVQKSFVTTDQ